MPGSPHTTQNALHCPNKAKCILQKYQLHQEHNTLFLPKIVIETYFPQICLVEIYYLSLFSIILQTPPPVENTKTNL